MKKILLSLVLISTVLLSGCSKTDTYFIKIANSAFENNDYKTAIRNYRLALMLDKNNSKAYTQYCACESYLYDKNKKINLEKAIKNCDKALEVDSKNYEAHFYKGRILSQLDKDQEAIEEYTKSININPNFSNAYLNRGAIYEKLKMNNEALWNYSKVIELNDPDMLIYGYSARANFYQNNNNLQNANKDIEKISKIEIKHNNAIDYELRGYAKFLIKDYNGAIFDFTQSVKLDDSIEDNYFYLAFSQILKEDFKNSEKTLDEAMKKFKNSSKLYYLQGLVNFEQKTRACSSNPNSCNLSKDDLADFEIAKELALKDGNNQIYDFCIETEKEAIKILKEYDKYESKNEEPPTHKSKLMELVDKSDSPEDFYNNLMGGYWENILQGEIQKYNMAINQKDYINACISAGVISQAYYELKDEVNYNKWNSIQNGVCE